MKGLLLRLIAFYQRRISPHLPDACRYIPSCSEYARVAIQRYGAARGTWMGFKRIMRCNPLFKGGYDPVPEQPDGSIRRD